MSRPGTIVGTHPSTSDLYAEVEQVWLVDFEFHAPDGERPTVLCMVALELRTGRLIRLWADELEGRCEPPYRIDDNALFVAFYASAEIGCHAVLGWQKPHHVLDLFTEFRNHTNGLKLPKLGGSTNSLLYALNYFGIPSMGFAEKEAMRELAINNGPWTPENKKALVDYCESDVRALEKLLPKMLPYLHLPFAINRGRYMAAAAAIEHEGIPLDIVALDALKRHWPQIKERLVDAVDADYGVYDQGSFRAARFELWLDQHAMTWPRLPSGKLMLDGDTFSDIAKIYPAIAPLAELRTTMSQLRLAKLAVGKDGRNRCLLSAFGASTGRNTPSNSKSVFGPSKWIRSLIKPPEGHAVAYIDWSAQEIGLVAKLSGDVAMLAAYESEDFYLATAKSAGAAPPDATKESHKTVRNQFKPMCLGVNYGQGAFSLAEKIGVPYSRGRELLEMHQRTYPQFWTWSQAALDHALLRGYLETVYGWRVRPSAPANKKASSKNCFHGRWTAGPPLPFNPRSLKNFPVQANAAEMMRLAACLATERGVPVAGVVHDAFVVVSPIDEIDSHVAAMRAAMDDASREILDGFVLKSSTDIVRYPARFSDERGVKMWNTVWRIIAELDPSIGDMLIPEGA